MKFEDENKNGDKKLKKGFLSVVAASLIIIGGATFFATSNVKNAEPDEYIKEENIEEYDEPDLTYIENEPQNEDVTENVENEPYEEETPAEAVQSYTMPVEGEILKDFSLKQLQYSKTMFDMRLHLGVDILCKEGSNIRAMSDGVVESIEETSDYGKVITIKHSDEITIKYASFKTALVKVGDKVKMGDVIGNSGTVQIECQDEAHIHIEAYKNGEVCDPLQTLGLK